MAARRFQESLARVRPPVSALEQTAPPYWNRSLYCFKLQDYEIDDIAEILSQALKATLASIPVLKAQVVAVQDDEQGRKDLVNGGIERLVVKDLTASSLDYDHLRAKDFPISTFDDTTFWATPCLPTKGEDVPVFAVQANFIKGGLLLGISFWHLVMDGPALATALRLFAQNCFRLQQFTVSVAPTLSDDCFDKSRLHESHPRAGGRLVDHPEYVLMPEAPIGPPPVPLKVEVFQISPTSLNALKVAATMASQASNSEEEPTWISTNDAVTALIWRSIMIATYGKNGPGDGSTSCCQIAVNGRSKMNPPLPADYFGCALTFATTYFPFSELVSAESLPGMALKLRRSITLVNAPYIESLVAMMNKVPDYRRFIPARFPYLLHRSTVMTSWAAFPLYDYDWGPALGGRCERVRAPRLGMYNGLQTVLPALPERLGGGLEVMIGLEPHVMERLKKDELWRQFCTPTE